MEAKAGAITDIVLRYIQNKEMHLRTHTMKVIPREGFKIQYRTLHNDRMNHGNAIMALSQANGSFSILDGGVEFAEQKAEQQLEMSAPNCESLCLQHVSSNYGANASDCCVFVRHGHGGFNV